MPHEFRMYGDGYIYPLATYEIRRYYKCAKCGVSLRLFHVGTDEFYSDKKMECELSEKKRRKTWKEKM